MTEPDPETDQDRRRRLREEAARKRRLAEVFGDPLPEQTADDVDPGAGSRGREEWLRGEVPPHHGS